MSVANALLKRPRYASLNEDERGVTNKNSVVANKNNISANNISIYPNPASSSVSFTSNKSNCLYQISIYNIDGQLIQQFNNQPLPYNYNINNLETGLYNVIFTNKNESHNFKFIKE